MGLQALAYGVLSPLSYREIPCHHHPGCVLPYLSVYESTQYRKQVKVFATNTPQQPRASDGRQRPCDGLPAANTVQPELALAQPESNLQPTNSASRRAWLLCTTSQAAAGVLAGSQGRAEAFPAQGLEQLQEASSTASSGTHSLRGIAALRDPAIFRGVATEKAVRRAYGLDGLLPSARAGLQQEVDRALQWIDRCCSDLDKWQALMTLKESNRDCFYAVVQQNLTQTLPLVYTPTVGTACKQWSMLLLRPTGLYISIMDQGNVRRLINNWPEEEVKIVVITDGERILGLGDLGANGQGIPTGKAIVHTAAGGIHPRFVLPITLDVGCNTPAVRTNQFYVGLPQERVRGAKYDALVDEVIGALRERYGRALLVHWEDFAAKNSFRLLAKYQAQGVPTFNDDIQSTAASTVAAVLGALKMQGVPQLTQQHFLMLGAGQANIGGARLLVRALMAEGLSEKEAKQRIWLFDSKGIVFEGRREGTLTPEKAEFIRSATEGKELPLGCTFAEAVSHIRPTAIIGAAARQGVFDSSVIQALCQACEERAGSNARPIVLALSNPDSQSECTAQQAYNWSGGRAVFASGTAFQPFRRKDGSLYVPGQANNSLIFPGVGMGCIASGATAVTEGMMLAAAHAVASKLTQAEISQGSILPQVDRISQVSLAVAAAVALTAAQDMVASASGADILKCLPLGKDPDDPETLRRARSCIAQLQYNPFASEVA